MTDPRKEVATGYGEGDIEAKAMKQTEKKPVGSSSAVPPLDTVVPAAGTTETDVGENLRQKTERESKS